jgi:hypothetical protein
MRWNHPRQIQSPRHARFLTTSHESRPVLRELASQAGISCLIPVCRPPDRGYPLARRDSVVPLLQLSSVLPREPFEDDPLLNLCYEFPSLYDGVGVDGYAIDAGFD